MRIALISDSHTKANIEFILDYIKEKSPELRIDCIVINGDILGEHEIRQGYGFNYDKAGFLSSLNKKALLTSLVPDLIDPLSKVYEYWKSGIKDDNAELELSNTVKRYVESRYDYLFEILKRFSLISRTLFNLGTAESSIHFNVLKELSFLLDVDEPYLRRIALHSNYRDSFKTFMDRINNYNQRKLKYIGGFTSVDNEHLFAGIPGMNPSPIPTDSLSQFQENITNELLVTVRRQSGYANKIILLNQTQGKLRKDPFAFRPASPSLRDFISSNSRAKRIFIQSYYHFMTTHFYSLTDTYILISNSAVNNCIFNLIETGSRVNCFDVDPRQDKIRLLRLYNSSAKYSSPEERLALNYDDWQQVIEERSLKGCYYM